MLSTIWDRKSNYAKLKPQKIINQLKGYSVDGLKFEEAKQKLLAEGYTEDDIGIALDEYQYGAQPEASDIPKKVTEYYDAHPRQAVLDGTALLKAKRKEALAEKRNKAILNIAAAKAAGQFGVMGTGSQVEYESKISWDLGVSFCIFSGVLIVAAGSYVIVTRLHLSSWLYLFSGISQLALLYCASKL